MPLIRSYSEDGWSNPRKILDRVLENLEEERTGNLIYESLLNRIMDYLYDQQILTTSKVYAKAIWKILETGCIEKLHKSLSDTVEDIQEDCSELDFMYPIHVLNFGCYCILMKCFYWIRQNCWRIRQ